MKRHVLRLARPLYEGLPWIYLCCGLLAMAGSYRHRGNSFSAIVGVLGIIAVIAAIVLLLRRRDFRQLREEYQKPSSLLDD